MQKVKHVRGSKIKYEPGTIVVTANGRRAQVRQDGGWRWLALAKPKAKQRPLAEQKQQQQAENKE